MIVYYRLLMEEGKVKKILNNLRETMFLEKMYQKLHPRMDILERVQTLSLLAPLVLKPVEITANKLGQTAKIASPTLQLLMRSLWV